MSVFRNSGILAVGLLHEDGILHHVEELAVLDAAVLDEGSDIVPVAFVGFPLRVHQAVQLIGNLLGDMRADLLHVAVILQEGTADVQRQVRAVDHALEQHQELRDDLLDVVRHEDLVVEQLDHALVGAELVFEPGEIQDALEVEGERYQ